jgi:radical SAM superfamily enzyme with C-terminal helix-hairpin-helix motif
METGRGCPRLQHCSFCSEGLARGVEFRDTRGIIDETLSLIKQGVTRFRIGRQPDIMQYGSSLGAYRQGFPEPEPSAVAELFSELGRLRTGGAIEVLNVDNCNPGSIANWPDHSAKILHSIASAVTEGDTLAFGIESFDQRVYAKNNLKVNMEEALFALRMVNEICGSRRNGIPVLLPGINLIQGLRGETADTFKINYEALRGIADEGLMVKRINIRRLQPYPGTALYNESGRTSAALLKRFEYYKGKIRDEIDRSMLKLIYPAGTILRKNLMLDYRDGYSRGKQIASYSITVKVAGETGRLFSDVIITGHRERSLSGLALPFNPNTVPSGSFETIPGIGRGRGSRIVLARPFSTAGEFADQLEGVPESVKIPLLENTVL